VAKQSLDLGGWQRVNHATRSMTKLFDVPGHVPELLRSPPGILSVVNYVSGGSSAAAAVPEPAGYVLIATIGIFAGIYRRRQM
jgi:hypothetical protein